MMTNEYWLRQTEGNLLFPDLAWSKPENKRLAGKLLVVGGNLHGFSAPAQAFNEASKAGIGATRVLLPDSIQKVVGSFIPEAEYGPSTPSGSFAQKSLDSWLDTADWADGVLLAGDFGRNSETAIILEKFITKYSGLLILADDAVDYFVDAPLPILTRTDSSLVLSFAQLQKLAVNARFVQAFTLNMDLLRTIETLHEFTSQYPAAIVTEHQDNILVAVNGQVSTTKIAKKTDKQLAAIAAHVAVWWLQHPNKQFESLTTALVA
jgi:hypothetical protein